MANKFKKGDVVYLAETSDYYTSNAHKDSNNPINTKGVVIAANQDSIFPLSVKWANKEINGYHHRDLTSIKPKTMAKTVTKAKKKVGGITPKEGMYFTATMNRRKIRGYVGFARNGIYASVGLYGKFFDEESDGDWPTQLILDYDDAEVTFEQELKRQGVNNFVVCTDKRQKAIIDGDQAATFRSWRVENDDGILVFGCGSVKIGVKDAKTFAEIFCDYGNPNEIHSYYETELGNLSDLEEYYQVRKYLEDNWTAAQKQVFDIILEQIFNSGEQEIMHLECSEMKKLLAKF